MKASLIFFLTLGILVLSGCQETVSEQEAPAVVTKAFDENQEKQDIMAVIESETSCFFERNYECWKEHWIHKDYAYQAWNNSDGTFSSAIGWDKIHNQGKSYIENIPEGKSKTSHPIVKREDILFKFYQDDVVYMIWKQYNSDRKNEFYSISQETRLMEKQNGQWKIVNVSSWWDEINKVPFDSVTL